jgi:CRP-like cAMP-binding protein
MRDPLFERFGREFPLGHVLFHEGDDGDVMFVIQTGAVRISKTLGTEKRALATLRAGEFVGETELLNDKPRRSTATVVEGPARCLVIDRRTLETMVTKNAEIALRLIKKLAKRLDAADSLIELLMHRDPKARVLVALIRQAEMFGELSEDGIRVDVSEAEIANDVGVPVDMARQLFVRVRRLRLIEQTDTGKVVVKDLARLAEFVGFLERTSKMVQSAT